MGETISLHRGRRIRTTRILSDVNLKAGEYKEGEEGYKKLRLRYSLVPLTTLQRASGKMRRVFMKVREQWLRYSRKSLHGAEICRQSL